MTACGGDGGTDPEGGIEGRWSGPLGAGTMTLTLQEDGGIVTGTGVLSGTGYTFTVTVTGTFDDPGFALNVETPGDRTATFASSVDGGVKHGP